MSQLRPNAVDAFLREITSVPTLVLIPLRSEVADDVFVVPAFVRSTNQGGLAAVVFGPAVRRDYFDDDAWAERGAFRPTFLRKIKTTDLPMRFGSWPLVPSNVRLFRALRAGESSFAYFVEQIAKAPDDTLQEINLNSTSDTRSALEAPEAAVPIFRAPENVPIEAAIAHLVGLSILRIR